MNHNEYHLYKIISGKTKLKIGNQEFEVLPPSYDALYEAADIYKRTYSRGYLYGALSRIEMIDYMTDRGLWSIEKEVELEKLPDQINNARADLYDSYTKFQDLTNKRKVIKFLDDRYNDLWQQKQTFDRFTIDGISYYHKLCFLICAGANVDYNNPAVSLNKLYLGFMNELINDSTIRAISRDNEWRQHWRAIKLGHKLFGDILTREQHSLISWSQFYDNINESSEAPPDEIMDDDDLIDGWCVVQRKKRKEEDKRKLMDRYGDAGEIFIPVSNPEQAAKINELNDGSARMIKRQREMIIQKKGSVLEQDMPDAKQLIKQQAMQGIKDRAHKR
jgi:hypothetical protein